MRREAALLIGALGSLLVLILQIATGTADTSAVAPAVETVLTTALPLLVGLVTRGAVYSRRTVDRVLEDGGPVVDDLVRTYGAPAVADLLRQAADKVARRLG